MEPLGSFGKLLNAVTIRGVLLALAACFVTHTLYQWRRLSHIKGPFWAAFSKYWMVRESLKGRQPTAIKEVTDKYGTFFAQLFGVA